MSAEQDIRALRLKDFSETTSGDGTMDVVTGTVASIVQRTSSCATCHCRALSFHS
jgi:hypothetical protein